MIRDAGYASGADRNEIEREVEKILLPKELPEIALRIGETEEIISQYSAIEQIGSCDLTVKKPAARLRQTGAEYKGLLGYYVDNRAVTFWADGKEIDADQMDELLEEIKEIIRIHKEFAKA